MDDNEKRQLYTQAWFLWGANTQVDMCIEEMSELTWAFLKSRRSHVVFSYAVFEEIADVIICLEQIETRLRTLHMRSGNPLWDQVERIKAEKLTRLQERVAKLKESGKC